MIGYCELCKLRKTCKYIYAEFCPYIIELEEELWKIVEC